jgi:hypothetical protein
LEIYDLGVCRAVIRTRHGWRRFASIIVSDINCITGDDIAIPAGMVYEQDSVLIGGLMLFTDTNFYDRGKYLGMVEKKYKHLFKRNSVCGDYTDRIKYWKKLLELAGLNVWRDDGII